MNKYKYTDKVIQKIIKFKKENRRISKILAHLKDKNEVFYLRDGSKFKNWTVFELERKMGMNSVRILALRSEALGVKYGT